MELGSILIMSFVAVLGIPEVIRAIKRKKKIIIVIAAFFYATYIGTLIWYLFGG